MIHVVYGGFCCKKKKSYGDVTLRYGLDQRFQKVPETNSSWNIQIRDACSLHLLVFTLFSQDNLKTHTYLFVTPCLVRTPTVGIYGLENTAYIVHKMPRKRVRAPLNLVLFYE